MKTSVGSIFFHIGDDDHADTLGLGDKASVTLGEHYLCLPDGSTRDEAQRIADAINAAIDGAKSRAAADAEAVKIAAQ